jgi:hypothetical protein
LKNDDSIPPLVLIHLGAKIPSYVRISARRAAKNYEGLTYLLKNSPDRCAIRGVTTVDLTRWYSSSRFDAFAESSGSIGDFRNGFWLKTAERFFVLHDWMGVSGYTKAIHIESDVVIFGIISLLSRLDAIGAGIFIPRDAESRAVGSLVYVNKAEELSNMISFFEMTGLKTNEMALLAAYLDSEGEGKFSLPTADSIDSALCGSRSWASLSPTDIGGVVDAAGLGQWVAGVDPRNTRKATYNHFRNECNDLEFSELRFRFDPGAKILWARVRGGEFVRVFNLHLHSKKIFLFLSQTALFLLVRLSQLQRPIPLESLRLNRMGLGLASLYARGRSFLGAGHPKKLR